jgi:1-acyl-sn-glycerol-3-phosphate acyltransferase
MWDTETFGLLYKLLHAFFWVLFRALFAVLGGLRVEGRENLPSAGAVIICPNHISFADPPLMGVAMVRPAWFMATDELFAYPILGKLARIMRGFPIRQDSPDRAALRKTEEILRKGDAVVVFPEGHVSKDGRLQPIQPGTLLIAIRAGVPVVPVGIIGSDRLMPPHTWKLRHAGTRIVVRFGKPLSSDELSGGLKGRAALNHGVAALTRAISLLIGAEEQPILAAEAQPAEVGSLTRS